MPYSEPLVPRPPAQRVVPEPPRRGEPGGEPGGICGGAAASAVWHDDLRTLHPAVQGSVPGTVWVASREHSDSVADMPAAAVCGARGAAAGGEHFDSVADMPAGYAAGFGRMAGRVERAIPSLGGVARVHLNRWGDGGARFRVWFIPRPPGMLDARGMHVPTWADVLPDAGLAAAASKVAAAMDD